MFLQLFLYPVFVYLYHIPQITCVIYYQDFTEISFCGKKWSPNSAIAGSLNAVCQLMEQLQATVLECLVVMELTDMKGRENVKAPVHSLIQF
jgi:hypothetical protein